MCGSNLLSNVHALDSGSVAISVGRLLMVHENVVMSKLT